MDVFCDPHLRRPHEFGVQGKTVRVGRNIMVVCTVIGAPPHRYCHQYHKSLIAQESKHRKKIMDSGEYGTRSLIVDRKGFNFRDIKKEKLEKSKESEDAKLKKMAFGWSVKETTEEEKESNQKSQEEGEKFAANRAAEKNKSKIHKKENNTKSQKKEIKTGQSSKEPKPQLMSQYKTHKNEISCKQCNSERVHQCRDDIIENVRATRGGWRTTPGGGLRGGAPAGRSSKVSTFQPIV